MMEKMIQNLILLSAFVSALVYNSDTPHRLGVLHSLHTCRNKEIMQQETKDFPVLLALIVIDLNHLTSETEKWRNQKRPIAMKLKTST